MRRLPESLVEHRMRASDLESVVRGTVRYAPTKSLWLTSMGGAAIAGGVVTFSWSALLVFLVTTASVLLLGHSLGSHRKLIHGSFECPKALEYLLVWLGVQVGLAGPIGLLRQHELRDYAQRLPDCHPYLRHGGGFWRDAWWQLHCDLHLADPPALRIEPAIARDRFYRFLERTWMLQQVPPALLLYAIGGVAFVVWGTCARVTAGIFGHWLIGYFAHNTGEMSYEVRGAAVQGRNVRFTSLLTMGECWHNNHHAFPGSARLGLFAGEWDPGWWMLMILRKLGLVSGLRLPADLPARPELAVLRRAPSGGVSRVRYRLADLCRLCWRTQLPCEIEGPAAVLSANVLRRIFGPRTPFRCLPNASRLHTVLGGCDLFGLPALCVGLSRRGRGGQLAALCAAPVAVLVENVRTALDVA